MADFYKGFEIVKSLEFSAPENALHWNQAEDGWTFMGIYQKAFPDSQIWKILNEYSKVLKDEYWLSKAMYGNNDANLFVEKTYKENFWDYAKLDRVDVQIVANKIFVFGVNVGMDNSIKEIQNILDIAVDGIVGSQTLRHLNSANNKLLCKQFDREQKRYYNMLVEHNPKLKIYLDGWHNRVEAT